VFARLKTEGDAKWHYSQRSIGWYASCAKDEYNRHVMVLPELGDPFDSFLVRFLR
jgi:hypothetical protein